MCKEEKLIPSCINSCLKREKDDSLERVSKNSVIKYFLFMRKSSAYRNNEKSRSRLYRTYQI